LRIGQPQPGVAILGLARRRGAQPRVEALDHAADRLLALLGGLKPSAATNLLA